jgi:type IV fimbrial biogenesis protein FimT
MHGHQHRGLLAMTFGKTSNRGFTLIELLVTIAIVVIATIIAVPSMVAFRKNAELTSAANNLQASINTARSEAMKRGMNAMVVPVDSTDWSKGWTVFVDKARDGDPTNQINIVVTSQPALPSHFTVTGVNVKFDASGFALGNNGTISITRNDVSGTEKLAQTRRVKVSINGRVRTCKPKSDTDTSCSS